MTSEPDAPTRRAERHARVKQIFLEARTQPLASREAFLDRSCDGDDSLLREVQSLLLRMEDLPESELDPTADDMRTPSTDRLPTALRIANYRVLQKVGEGGMGEVYEAEQQAPVRRRVALKVLKGGLATKEIVARFESERQALAMMSHPNIAQVFEAGATERERPYFAMELVHGEPITDYCDRHRLTTRDRLKLFVEVCAGVQHAHQKGIIHRDLKPSNVLVAVEDGQARPKIIDFGVAKATAQPLTERTLFTELGQWIGTPEYMSPEQAEMTGLDIDTRTDVYSLGVLLYELLAGERPFDLKALRRGGFDEMRRRIREEDPTRPSTKVSGLGDASELAARNRRADVVTLVQQLRGDLDWITMKALDKDRTRRYDTPSDFAADVRRHLADEPVVACPPSAIYKLRKFVRRNRLVVTATALVAAALLIGFVITALALHQARSEAERANQVADFLQEFFGDFNPYSNRTGVSAERMLDRAAERIETELVGQDLVRARLMFRVGVGYRHLDLFGRSERLLEGALPILESELGRDHREVVSVLYELGGLAYEKGDYPRSRTRFDEALEIQRRAVDADDPRVAEAETEVGFACWNLGDFTQAEELLTRSLATLERAYGPEHVSLARNLFLQGVLFNNTGEYRRARSALERALRIEIASRGVDHLRVGWTRRTLARAEFFLGDYEKALDSARRAQEIMEGSLGPEHSDLAYVWETLGTIHRLRGHFAEARPMLERSLELRETALGPDHVELGLSLNKLAEYHLEAGEPETAAPLLERALTIDRRSRPADHPATALTLNALSRQRLLSGRIEDALTLEREAVEIVEARSGPEALALAAHLAHLGVLLRESGDIDAARPALERALRLRERQLGPAHRRIADDLKELAVVDSLAGDSELATQLFDRAIAMYEATVGRNHPAVPRCLTAYAEHLRRMGRTADAAEAEGRAAAVKLDPVG